MLALGIDIGTSGVRSAVLDESGTLLSSSRSPHLLQVAGDVQAEYWWASVRDCLAHTIDALHEAKLNPRDIEVLAVDGTSGSMVLVDATICPVTPALMYNSSGFDAEAELIRRHGPANHITQGSNSALARLIRLQSYDMSGSANFLCHQADFVMARLTGVAGFSDHNNALKTGYDPQCESWPDWLEAAGVRTDLLPRVLPPGRAVRQIDAKVAEEFGLAHDLVVKAGTTDSIAAYLATGASEIGTAVTSLGTTLAVKMLSPARIEDPSIGLYSHKLGDAWIAGGASNSGGGVLLRFFDEAQLRSLSGLIDPSRETDLDYYPLLRPGERFPTNDPDMLPRITPRPEDDVHFLHGLLQGIARIESQGYKALERMGGGAVQRVLTVGGGAGNETWRLIREREIGVPVETATRDQASIGAALLALREN